MGARSRGDGVEGTARTPRAHFFARLFAARLSFFILASTETTLEPFVAPLGADVALRTPLFDFEATTYTLSGRFCLDALAMARSTSFNFRPALMSGSLATASARFFAALSRASARVRFLARASATFLIGFAASDWNRAFISANNSGLMGTCGR